MKSYVTVREALEAENIDARSASRKGGSRLSLSNFQEGHVSRRAAASTPLLASENQQPESAGDSRAKRPE